MELLEFLRLVGRYRTTIALMCASAALTALALTYVLTERYSASALVLVRPQEEMRLVGGGSDKETLDFPLPQVVPFEAMTRTFGEVIRSAAVVEPVVLRLGLDQPTVETAWWKRLKTWTKNRLSDAWALLKYGSHRGAGSDRGCRRDGAKFLDRRADQRTPTSSRSPISVPIRAWRPQS